MRLRELGIEPASLAKQFPRLDVVLARHLVEMPSPAPHQVPGRHIASVPRRRLGALTLEQFRFDSTRNALSDLVLDGKNLRQLQVVAFSPDMFG
jgi:hypothetical protein